MITEGGSPGGTPPQERAAGKPSDPEHPMLRHWLPWLLPNAAIGLAVLSLLFAQVRKNEWDLIAQAVQRGDFFIPIIIICADAFLRWLKTKFDNSLTAFLGPLFGCLSGFFVVILLLAYGFIAGDSSSSSSAGSSPSSNCAGSSPSSSPSSPSSSAGSSPSSSPSSSAGCPSSGPADFANIMTWVSFGVGFLAGTLALWETRPKKPKKPKTPPGSPPEAGTSS